MSELQLNFLVVVFCLIQKSLVKNAQIRFLNKNLSRSVTTTILKCKILRDIDSYMDIHRILSCGYISRYRNLHYFTALSRDQESSTVD